MPKGVKRFPTRAPKLPRLTRHEAARILGVSVEATRELCEGIALEDEFGVTYDKGAVEQLAAKRSAVGVRAAQRTAAQVTAEQEAQAFEAFESGLDVVATTIRLRLRPTHVAELHAQYARHRPVLTVQGSTLHELAAVFDLAPEDLTPARLLELVSQLRERLRLRRRHEATESGNGEGRGAYVSVARSAGEELAPEPRAVLTRASAVDAARGD